MPSIKSLLREFANQSACRFADSDFEHRISISLTQDSTTYYPPADGWLVLNANGSAVQTELFGSNLETLSVNNFGTWGRCSLPVRKGSKCTINIWGISTATEKTCFFVPNLASV